MPIEKQELMAFIDLTIACFARPEGVLFTSEELAPGVVRCVRSATFGYEADGFDRMGRYELIEMIKSRVG